MTIKTLLLTLLILTGCQRGPNGAIAAAEAIELANDQLAEGLPQVPLEMMRIESENRGDAWRVTYFPPEGSTGNPLVFEVNKQSREIVANPWPDSEQGRTLAN